MIISKANLQAASITRKDKSTPALYVMYLQKDGTTCCLSQQALLIVSPVLDEIKKGLTFLEEKKLEGELLILNCDTVNDVIKNMPRDVLFSGMLEHCDIDDSAHITISDGKQRKIIKGLVQQMEPMPYRSIISKALGNKQSVRSVVNLVRLRALLDSIEKSCGDQSGELPVYIEFSTENDLIIRAVHPRTQQRMIGVMTTYKGIEGQWLEEDQWEEGLKAGSSLVEKKKAIKFHLKKEASHV